MLIKQSEQIFELFWCWRCGNWENPKKTRAVLAKRISHFAVRLRHSPFRLRFRRSPKVWFLPSFKSNVFQEKIIPCFQNNYNRLKMRIDQKLEEMTFLVKKKLIKIEKSQKLQTGENFAAFETWRIRLRPSPFAFTSPFAVRRTALWWNE